MGTTLKWSDGATTSAGNALTLIVDTGGLWHDTAGASRHLISLDASMNLGEALALTLERASSAVPNLRYALDGAGWSGTTLAGGNYRLTLPTPASPTTHSVTAVPPTPPAPADLTITVRRQGVGLMAAAPVADLHDPAE
ncbi:MAG: hypothetical protein IPH07_28845 [Deltaproteobacteria bacterium]|nr:hypothetical protein [Deltaproteobacteria bacterium]MBK8714914.1 hypothetical protein [Deltaproteobacteria bacterium]MBP7287444.1 hypothetical protein [Nannocystaceae bacterium]